MKHTLEDFRFNVARLTDRQQKVLRKIVGGDLTPAVLPSPAEVASIDPGAFRDMEGVGEVSESSLVELQGGIAQAITQLQKAPSVCYQDSILVPLDFGAGFATGLLLFLVMEDLERFAVGLEPDEYLIWTARNGLMAPKRTLDSLGEELGVTRERIRQREDALMGETLASMRVSKNVLCAAVLSCEPIPFWDAAEHLYGRFDADPKVFAQFIASLCGVEPSSMRSRFWPEIDTSALLKFFQEHGSPVSTALAVEALAAVLKSTEAHAQFYLTRLVELGHVDISAESVTPRALRKEPAIVHILAGLPDGAGWQEIARQVNAAGICNKEISLKRPDPVLNTSGWIYQNGRGHYRHTLYLSISESDADHILLSVSRFLESHDGSSANLYGDYYVNVAPDYGYYDIRHVIRTRGQDAGIFFDGKSAVDSIALNKDAPRRSQIDVVQAYVEEQGAATASDAASVIRSHDASHALLYLTELCDRGSVVRQQRGTFVPVESAFAGIDIPQALELLSSAITLSGKRYHVEWVAARLSVLMGCGITPNMLRGLILKHGAELNIQIDGALIANGAPGFSSVAGLVRSADKGLSGSALVSWVASHVEASPEKILEAIHHTSAGIDAG